jgi:RNA polymerase sigma-70 factor (ECF subfamily)
MRGWPLVESIQTPWRELRLRNEIEDAILNARAAWPGVTVSNDVFFCYVRDRLPADLKGTHLSDLYLACACAQKDLSAIALFQKHFLSELRRTLSHLRPTDEFAKDVRQVLMEHWFVPDRNGSMRISQYTGRGPLKRWVRAVALATALNLQRKGRQEVPADEVHLLEAAGLVDGSELAFLRARYRGELEAALTSALTALSPRDRNVLRLHYLSGMTYEQVGAIYRVHRGTVARWLASSRQAILQQLSQSLTSRLGVSQSQLQSLLRDVRSQLDISLTRLLTESHPQH